MKSFFSPNQTKSKTRPGGKTYSCASCGLHQYVLTPKMQPFGDFKKGILNIGEAPGEDEDKKGKQWQGKMGRALRKMYEQLGIDLFEDCLNINSVNCRPTSTDGNNRTPTDYEIACCRKHVLKVINQYQPNVVILLGGSAAVKSIIGSQWQDDLGGITRWRGWTIPDRELMTWICPTFHPSYIERQDSEVTNLIWKQDLERAIKLAKNPPKIDTKDHIKYVEIVTQKRVSMVLEKLQKNGKPISIDIETTGLKPYASGHKIVCIALCNRRNKSYVIPSPTGLDADFLRQILEDERISKIAANMKFEDTWFKVIYGVNTKGWEWDTMQAAHVLDNRPGISGLKFQTYARFGVAGYDESTNKYLKGKDKKNSNSFNRVEETDQEELMTYCGLDALYTYRLAMLQKRKIDANS